MTRASQSSIGPSKLAREFWLRGRVADCPVIDMHGHMGPWKGIYFPRAEPEEMLRSMDSAGVRMLVFSHHAALFAPDVGNSAAVEAVRRHPDRFRAYLAVNPHYPEAVARDLDGFDDHRDVFVGLKFLASYHKVALTDPRYRRAWEFADERGLLVLSHTWGGSSFDGPAQVGAMARRYKRLTLLAGHSFHADWDAAVGIARECPNVYLELTAVLDDRGAVEKLAANVGSERMLFGTDLPWFDPHHGIGALLSADIADGDRRNILYRNAERLLAPFLTKRGTGEASRLVLRPDVSGLRRAGPEERDRK